MRRDVFQAIADPIRRQIIELLAEEPLTVNGVAENFEISRPAISKHLRILKECGIIELNKRGREQICYINTKSLVPAFLWIERHHKLWEDQIDSFEEYINKIQNKRKNESKMEETKNRTLAIEKTLDAPIQLVWEAWTNAEHIAKWWAPRGMETKIIEQDFKVGGKWKFSMQMPDGNEFIAEGIYSEIDAPNKLITSADFKPMTVGVEMHVLLEEMDAQTKFTFHVIHPSEEYCKQQEEMGFYNGWGSAFERLYDYLNSL